MCKICSYWLKYCSAIDTKRSVSSAYVVELTPLYSAPCAYSWTPISSSQFVRFTDGRYYIRHLAAVGSSNKTHILCMHHLYYTTTSQYACCVSCLVNLIIDDQTKWHRLIIFVKYRCMTRLREYDSVNEFYKKAFERIPHYAWFRRQWKHAAAIKFSTAE